MTRSGTYGTKQNKVDDCHQWPVHHQGATGVSKQVSILMHKRRISLKTLQLSSKVIV